MLSGFDGLDKQLFNLKDVMRRDLQVKNQRLHMKRNCLENKVISIEIDGNHLKQYRERNNLEILVILRQTSEIQILKHALEFVKIQIQ